MHQQHVLGFMTPENLEGLTFERRQQIYSALVKSGLSSFLSLTNWEQGKHDISKPLKVRDIGRFIQVLTHNLTQLVKSEGVAQLRLRGEITVVAYGKQRTEYRIVVRNGKVASQRGIVQWQTELVAQ